MRVLGLSFSGHGSAMCLVEDGRIVCAVNLERLTRKKFSLTALPAFAETLTFVFGNIYERTSPPEFFNFYEVFPRMLEYVTGETQLDKAEIDLVVKTRDNIYPPKAELRKPDYAGISAAFWRHPRPFRARTPFEELYVMPKPA